MFQGHAGAVRAHPQQGEARGSGAAQAGERPEPASKASKARTRQARGARQLRQEIKGPWQRVNLKHVFCFGFRQTACSKLNRSGGHFEPPPSNSQLGPAALAAWQPWESVLIDRPSPARARARGQLLRTKSLPTGEFFGGVLSFGILNP